ncbi:o-spanin [Escherichia phage AlfredRasser]|nr:o-spanin [Escherichia phage AlfredRasser]
MKSGNLPFDLIKPKSLMKSLLILLLTSTIVGCSSQKNEPRVINVKPQPEPLNASILQAMQPDSTQVLKKADVWLKNSRQLLDSVITN